MPNFVGGGGGVMQWKWGRTAVGRESEVAGFGLARFFYCINILNSRTGR